MLQFALFVEPFCWLIVPAVPLVAIFWFGLGRDRTLLLPFVISAVFMVGVSAAVGLFAIFLISPLSLMVGLTLHLLFAAQLSYPVRRLVRLLISDDAGRSSQ